MEKARELRKNRRAEMAKRVLERYYSDSNYRFLHDKISDFFSKSLKSDIGFLNSGEFKKIGLAAKWCPFALFVIRPLYFALRDNRQEGFPPGIRPLLL